MTTQRFDQPVYVQRAKYIEEIGSLDDLFDFLEAWPECERGLAFETMEAACRAAYIGQFPIQAVRENFIKFLRRAKMLASLEDMPNLAAIASGNNISGA